MTLEDCAWLLCQVGQALNPASRTIRRGRLLRSPVVVAAITCASKRQVGTASLDGAYLCASKQVA